MSGKLEAMAEIAYEKMMDMQDVSWPRMDPTIGTTFTWSNENERVKNNWRETIRTVLTAAGAL